MKPNWAFALFCYHSNVLKLLLPCESFDLYTHTRFHRGYSITYPRRYLHKSFPEIKKFLQKQGLMWCCAATLLLIVRRNTYHCGATPRPNTSPHECGATPKPQRFGVAPQHCHKSLPAVQIQKSKSMCDPNVRNVFNISASIYRNDDLSRKEYDSKCLVVKIKKSIRTVMKVPGNCRSL